MQATLSYQIRTIILSFFMTIDIRTETLGQAHTKMASCPNSTHAIDNKTRGSFGL